MEETHGGRGPAKKLLLSLAAQHADRAMLLRRLAVSIEDWKVGSPEEEALWNLICQRKING